MLFSFPKDVAMKVKWSDASKLSMVKEGFLCQKHFRVGDVVFGKRPKLLHGSVPSEVSSEDASRRLAGGLSVEYGKIVGKCKKEKRTCAEEKVKKVVKELAERYGVRCGR